MSDDERLDGGRDTGGPTIDGPTLLAQLGGVRGMLATVLPVVVLVPVEALSSMGPALIAALSVAAAVFVWRLLRRDSLQPAISGFIGVAFCAAIAWFMGEARGYFLFGIWASAVFCVVCVASLIAGWPIVGVVWEGLNGRGTRWRAHRVARAAYGWATAAWAAVFAARFVVQQFFYDAEETTALGVARLIMGLPLTAAVVAVTIWQVRRARRALSPAEAEDNDAAGDPAPAEHEEER